VAVTYFADVPKARNLDAVQIVLCDPHYWGGMRQVQHLSHMCGVLGMGLSMHSNSHLGVSLIAMTHVAAACPNLTFACDTHYPWRSATDEIVAGGRIPIDNGCVSIPGKPGLGVELDLRPARPRPRALRNFPIASATTKTEMRRDTSIPTGSEYCPDGSGAASLESQRARVTKLVPL
jgi:glucarate dehydratase